MEEEVYTSPAHTHNFIRIKDESMIQEYNWSCDCGALLDYDPGAIV